MTLESKCRVSVVVPTYKRPALLARCLTALMAQDFDALAYEVIIADDAACDETRCEVEAWAERMARCGKTVRYVSVQGTHGPAAARNAGWRAARGPIIAFTDDDCVPAAGWLRAGVAAFSDGVLGVAGRLHVPLPEDRLPTDYELNASHLATARFITANCFYRRSCPEAIGGFDERFTMAWREDSDLIFTLMEREVWRQVPSEDGFRVGAGEERTWGEGPCGRPLLEWSKPVNANQGGRPQGPTPPISTTPAPTRDVEASLRSPDDSFLEKAFVYAPDALVVHPLRPASWGVSLQQQHKSMFNALLYRKHPYLYREKIQAAPPWHYYGIIGALLALLLGIMGKKKPVMLAGGGLWLWLTGRFCVKRLHRTSRKPGHVAEMVVTSLLIPPLAVFWRLWGAVKFRVWFL